MIDVASLAFAGAMLAAAPAAQLDDGDKRYLAAESIACAHVKGALTTSAEDARWTKAAPSTVVLHVQRTLALNDKDANAAVARHPPVPVTVRAMWNDVDVAVRLDWRDDTEDRASADADVNAFADSAAIETPLSFGAGERLPYVGMGDDAEPVFVDLTRAIDRGSIGREYVAAGFGSLTRSKAAGAKMAMRYDAAKRMWTAVIVRPLSASSAVRAGVVPVAFALWNGALHERAGNKVLSSWHVLRLDGGAADAAYVHELAFGYHDGDLGDAAKAKPVVETVCVACHRFGDKKAALDGMAPDLSDIGVIATPGYLRDSLVDPSLVLVPTISVNRHQNQALYAWSTVDANGKRTSKMPPFSGLAAADLKNIVAYLKALGADEAQRSEPTQQGSTP